MLDEINAELVRLSASDIKIALDDEFEPAAGTLLRVERAAYWHLLPERFLLLLKELPNAAGSEAGSQTSSINRH